MGTTFSQLRDRDGAQFHAIFSDDCSIMTEEYEDDAPGDLEKRHEEHCAMFLAQAATRNSNVKFKLAKCQTAQ